MFNNYINIALSQLRQLFIVRLANVVLWCVNFLVFLVVPQRDRGNNDKMVCFSSLKCSFQSLNCIQLCNNLFYVFPWLLFPFPRARRIIRSIIAKWKIFLPYCCFGFYYIFIIIIRSIKITITILFSRKSLLHSLIFIRLASSQRFNVLLRTLSFKQGIFILFSLLFVF